MSNKTKSRFLRNRTLSRFAALGGTAIIVSSLLMTVVVTTASAAVTGARFPTTTGVPTNAWTTPSGAFADGGALATARPANNNSLSQGYATFGLTTADGNASGIPGGSIIDGIAVSIEASSTDSGGCTLEVGLSGSGGPFRLKTIANVSDTLTVYNLGGAADTWGQIWDPTQLTDGTFRVQLRAIDGGSGCNDADAANDQSTFSVDYFTVTVTFRTINAGTSNAAISNSVCDQADFNFVIDMSGSIGAQGSAPSNLPELQAGIADFVDTFQASGDGRYSGTKFNGDLGAVAITAGYVSAATFKTAIGPPPGLSNPAGLTPTGAGITSGAGNTANDRAGVQNIMFVVTDGSPNVPPGSPLDSPPTWLTAANAAIAAANTARSSFVVKAVYLRTDDDPGDTTLPFSILGDAQWASNVMREIGGGSFLLGDFSDFATDLLTTLHCNPDIEVTKSAANTPINAGATASFTITLTNIGKGTANGVTLTDSLPAGISWSINPAVTGCSITTGVLNCNFGTLASGAVRTVTVTGLTDGGDCGPLPNMARGDATNEPASVLGNNEGRATITVICADLDLTKTADAVSVSAGSQIGFRVTIANTSAGTATGLSFTDALPGGTGVNWSIESSDPGWSITGVAPTQSLVYTPTTLAGNSDTEVHVISGTTAASCKAYVNNASVSATNDGDDTAQATTTVNCPVIDLTKTADAVSVSAGSPIGFTVTINNTGAGTATGLVFTDALPGGPGINWSIPVASAGWSITGVAPTQSLVYTPTTLAGNTSTSVHVVSATTAASCAAYLNSAGITAGNGAGDTAQATTTVNCPVIDLTKTADAVSVSAGSPIGFTVTINNTGAGTATGLVFTDALPGGPGINWSIPVASAGWSITGVAPTQSLVYTPTTLAGNTSTSVHVVSATTAASCAAYLNSAGITAGNGAGDTAQATTTVNCPVIDLTKTADAVSVSAGSPIGFTVTINNTGAGTATGLVFTDALPGGPGINWSIPVASAGWSITGVAPTQSLVYTPTTLAGNTSTSVHVVSNTTSDSCGSYPNSASVTAGNGSGDQAQATTAVNCADIDINKVADDESVSAGDNIGFTITVTNTGEGTAMGVHVEDELPTDAGLNWTAGPVTGPNAADASCVIELGFLTCDAVSLEPGGSFSVRITSPTTGATVATSPVENTAEVTTTNDGDDESTDDVVVLGASIAIDKEADDPVVNAGDQIGFRVTISNAGPGQAKGVHVTDTLPTDAGLSWTLDDNAGGLCALAAGVVTCDKATLDMGETIVFHVTSDTNAATAEESPVENEACVDTTNDGVDVCANDQTEVLGADIQIAKVAEDDSVDAGDPIAFNITVTNNGDGTATGVHVEDELPTDAGLSWTAGAVTGPNAAGASCAIAAGFLTCDAASLPSGGSFSVRISSPTTWATAATSPVENTADVTTTNDGEDSSTDDVEVLAPAITIDKLADDEVVDAGEAVGFTVTIGNDGPGIAKGVLVTDTLPTDAGLSWILDDNAGGLCELASGVVTCEKATLGVGETFSFHVTSTTTAATVADSAVFNEACVIADNQAGGECDDDETEVLGAEITIVKEADDDQVAVGETIGFKVTISNAGPGQAKGVLVEDTLPTDAGLSWILDDNAGGLCELASGIVTCDKDTLDVGETIVFHVTSTTTVATAETSPVENEACVETTNDGEACAGDEVGVSSLIIDKENNAPLNEELDIQEAPVGSTVTYTLQYTFTGDPVTNGIIVDTLPEGVEYIEGTATNSDEFLFFEDGDPATLTWKAANVTKSGSLQYQVKVLEEAEGFGPLTNIATIDSDQTEEDDAESSIFVPTVPEAETSKPTPPQTDFFDGSDGVAGPGISLLLMFGILGALILGLAFVTPVPEAVRRRNRR